MFNLCFISQKIKVFNAKELSFSSGVPSAKKQKYKRLQKVLTKSTLRRNTPFLQVFPNAKMQKYKRLQAVLTNSKAEMTMRRSTLVPSAKMQKYNGYMRFWKDPDGESDCEETLFSAWCFQCKNAKLRMVTSGFDKI